jgi:tryptophanyl-tRNA synthetase
MTVEYEPKLLQGRILDMATDFLACGVDPEKCTLFVQSQVPEHLELSWTFNTLTPLGDLYRMTQFKDKRAKGAGGEEDGEEGATNIALLDYPVLQAADILLYHATMVPVGEDQVQHIELTRRIARRFNNRFKKTFREPEWVLSKVPRLLGLDGNAKMSKSKGNTICLGETEKQIRKKLNKAVTDTRRERRTDPGEPNDCNLYNLHKIYSNTQDLAWVEQGCRSADIGCGDCKKRLGDRMLENLAPIRERKSELEKDPDFVRDVLEAGGKKARAMAAETMEKVRKVTGLRV